MGLRLAAQLVAYSGLASGRCGRRSAKVSVATTWAEYSPRLWPEANDRLDAAFGEHAGGGDRDGEDGWLRVLGELELVFGAFEDELRDREAEGFVGPSKTARAVGKLS